MYVCYVKRMALNVISFSLCPSLFLPAENSDPLEVHILSGGTKLQIARPQRADSGNYTCVASNMEGKAQKNYILFLQGKLSALWSVLLSLSYSI